MRIVFFCLILLYAFQSNGQVDTLTYLKSTNDFKELLALDSLKDKGESSVASYLRIPVREAPATISVLTQEDIEKSGARDLRELLMLLPGIDFEVDVQNNLGMGIRGLWGEEGKVLILWDGNIMNETSYGTFSFNQHIYLGNIQRIEMIRGPGSAIYGGLAGLAVINITSKNYADSFTPGYLSQSIGFSQNKLSHQVTQLGVGNKWKNGLLIQATGTLAKANISNRIVADTINYADSSAIDTRQFGIQGNYKNLDFSMLYDGHKIDVVEGLGRTVFTGWYGQLNYQWKLSERLVLFPTVRMKIQEGWNIESPGDESYNTINHRYTGGLRLQYETSSAFNLIGGAEYFIDDAVYKDANQVFTNGDNRISYSNVSAFAQAMYKSTWANITLGGRLDVHSAFGAVEFPAPANAPRFWPG